MSGIATPVIEAGWVSKGFQQVTSLSAAAKLTVPDGASFALIQCTTQNVRWRADGTAPTTTVGMQMLATSNSEMFRGHEMLEALQFIEETGSAVLNVHYFTG